MKKRFKAKIYEANEVGLKGANISCNIIDDVKPPIWFIEFEKRNNARWDRQEEFNRQQIKFNQQVIDRLDGVDNRLDNIEGDIVVIKKDIKQINARIDNLVVKNNLGE